MSEKTPYQIMREIQKRAIEKQKFDAENRALAYKYGISFTNTTDLQNKIAEKVAEEKRKKIEWQIAEDERRANAKRRTETKQKQDYVNRSHYYDQGYSGSSSTTHSSYDGGGSSSSGGGDCGSSSSSSSSCDF